MNKKVYVGQTTKDLATRWRWHIDSARGNQPWPISQAIKKYGKGNFTIVELCRADNQEELDFLEVLFIGVTCSSDSYFGYNIQNGGRREGFHSEETKRVIREKLKARIYLPEWSLKVSKNRKGIPMTEEGKKKLSEINKGNKLSEKTKQKIRTNSLFMWKNRTIEQKRIIGRKIWESRRKNEQLVTHS